MVCRVLDSWVLYVVVVCMVLGFCVMLSGVWCVGVWCLGVWCLGVWCLGVLCLCVLVAGVLVVGLGCGGVVAGGLVAGGEAVDVRFVMGGSDSYGGGWEGWWG